MIKKTIDSFVRNMLKACRGESDITVLCAAMLLLKHAVEVVKDEEMINATDDYLMSLADRVGKKIIN